MEHDRKMYLCHWKQIDKQALVEAIAWCGRWQDIVEGTRVLVKPNLTFPFYKPGVTTAPDVLRAVTELLLERGARVTICEGGPSLDVYSTQEAFKEHGILALRDEFGINVVDLGEELVTYRNFGAKPAGQNIPVPKIIEDTDVFISMPLVKVHAMTTVSLALKNQWGIIPTRKRFLLHSAIDDILIGLNALLPKPLVICDARTVLDHNGPMFGAAKPGGFLAVSNDPGAFDFVISQLMGFNPLWIRHIRAGMKTGLVPHSLDEISLNADPMAFRPFRFTLRRTVQNYVALAGFRSRWIGKLGYDSVLSNLLHRILYAIKGNPLREAIQKHEANPPRLTR